MFFVRPTLTRFTSFTSAFLIYALIILIGAPFSTAGTTTSKTTVNSSGASQGEASSRRDGELLVKFRGGVSQAERNTVLAAHGARRKKQLRGDSSVEQLELLGGQDPRTVALQLLSTPQVELAEPHFLITKGAPEHRPERRPVWLRHRYNQRLANFDGNCLNSNRRHR